MLRSLNSFFCLCGALRYQTLFCLAVAFTSTMCVQSDVNCKKYNISCDHGVCVETVTTPVPLLNVSLRRADAVDANRIPKATCLCDEWWSGPSCDIFACSGRMILSAPVGKITDGTGNYSIDNKCTWLIEGNDHRVPVTLHFDEFVTECSWDHLYIFDGSSVYDPLLAVYSGMIVVPGSSEPHNYLPDLTARSGSAYLYFYSDVAVNMSGFKIRYSLNACPANCSGNGQCQPNGKCHCYEGWQGVLCDQSTCPNNCSFPYGSCIKFHGCLCSPGYRGYDCSLPSSRGVWSEVVPDSSSFEPPSVASHTAVVVENQLWVLCGYSFVSYDSCSMLARFYLNESSKWEAVKSLGSSAPTSRYGHSSVVYQSNIYMYGGAVGKVTSNELWLFNTSALKWTLVESTTASFNDTYQVAPLAVTGHSAVCVGMAMYVIFGHNPTFGYLDIVQRYDFVSGEWSVINTTGAVVKGGYGHTSVYDSATGLILVHGGFQSQSVSTYSLSDGLYSFNPATAAWFVPVYVLRR